ncbi:F-box/FBD/LRR-repeat protein At1g13570-like isoform X1 [Ananas comosus]|uniref:F-box/FBD/LRR-repeat protein At1g13570-like isoform X1 n=1 Tax=Ananas comosus TaxID=4615 RepID=A0A6P5FSY8_ANACO|nr:F-box/FBD/LRR-repeat protein At1g13570-like isoform X1 [Ananas comosus]
MMDSFPSRSLSPPSLLHRKRKRTSGESGTECQTERDRISKLPDHLLACILERTDVRTAVATSLLSRRWRCVWKSLVDFKFVKEPILGRRAGPPSSAESRRDPAIRRHRVFSKCVSGFLGLKDGPPTIRKLSLEFSAKKKDLAMVDGWIRSALEKGVHELKLKLGPNLTEEYIFPPLSLNGGEYSLTKLKLSGCSLHNHAGFSMFGSLSSLSLEDMDISKDDMQGVLQNCRRLKSLCLADCSFSGADLSIASPDLQLKELAIVDCEQIRIIELSAPRLERLQYMGQYTPMLFTSVPHLDHVWLKYANPAGTNYILRKLSTDLPRSRNLNLFFQSYVDVKVPCLPACFGSLKNLTVNVDINSKTDLLWMAILLEAAPFLETLQTSVKTSDSYCSRSTIPWKPSDFVHHHLVEVKMYNFEGYCGEMAFARLLLAKAVDLRSMTFNRDNLFATPRWKMLYYKFSKQWTEQQTSVLLKQLTEGISTSASLVFR